MRNATWALLMITVGVFAYNAGLNAQTTTAPRVVSVFQTEEPHMVLIKSGTRQQKEAREQTEGCQLVPNENLSRQNAHEEESSVMKGLVF